MKQITQHGLGRKNTGNLQTIWVELPGYCNLACSYCFARGGENINVANLLTWENYESIIDEAKKIGINSISIPGAGEPFIAKNLDLTMRFLRKCAEVNIFVTLFTTAEFITDALAEELWQLPVELMIKGNSLNSEMQDRFVSDPNRGRIIHGFGERRNAAIELLMRHGFNNETNCTESFNCKSRMALVSSIMTDESELSNYDEIVDIMRFCRKNNFIFDCDSVLGIGRGASCSLCTADERLKAKMIELQRVDREEFGNLWEISQSYVGAVCDRYHHHLYVDQYGEIRPCIGANNVHLGNVKSTSLLNAFNKTEMVIIRNKQYSGKCAEECANFAEGKCNSCLGRRTKDLTNDNLLAKDAVETIGCWNFRKKVW